MNYRQIQPTDPEASSVAAMIDRAFGYYGGPYWTWKYADTEGARSVIVIAEEDQQVVGCCHYLRVDYHLGDRGPVPALFGGDLLVEPGVRRRHISTELSLTGRQIVAEVHPEAELVALYTWRELGAHYERLLGYARVKPAFNQWSKRLTWKSQLERLKEYNKDLLLRNPDLAHVDHVLQLKLDGAPELILEVGPRGFRPVCASERPMISIVARSVKDLPTGFSVSTLVSILLALISRRLRFRGSFSAFREAYAVRGAYVNLAKTLTRE